jgi:hypothetical protein
MRSFTLVAAAAVAAVLGVASSAAAQGNLVPKPGGAFTPPPQSKPLFPQILKGREQALQRLQHAKGMEPPTVVCGMTVIPANPAVDPKSIKKAPNDKKYTMRSVPPGICGQDSNNPPMVVVPPPTVAPR